MFSATGDEIVYDDDTMPYIRSMPPAANEGLQLLSTAGKFIVKSIEIIQDISETVEVRKYKLNELASDFYSLCENQIFFNGGQKYERASNYGIEGHNVLVLNSMDMGKWTVYYNSYPEKITRNTPDDFEMDIDPEVAVLLPLYMASQLYKDDDMGMSVQYRNEFEVGREMLRAEDNFNYCHEEFKSITGWW